jgi:phage shock protein PspC (stress-responsive transcriptional regulator)
MATKKTLYRIPKDGKIAGVCAGLADYFDMDVTLMRVLFVVGAFLGSAGFWIYLILILVMPVSGGAKIKK